MLVTLDATPNLENPTLEELRCHQVLILKESQGKLLVRRQLIFNTVLNELNALHLFQARIENLIVELARITIITSSLENPGDIDSRQQSFWVIVTHVAPTIFMHLFVEGSRYLQVSS